MATTVRPPANKFVGFARKVYNPVGFSKGYNFILWFICSGALLGFTLARLEYLDFFGRVCNRDRNQRSLAAPGECFALLEPLYSGSFIAHMACILPGSLLALVQFVPVVRHKVILFHRVNGYIVILLATGGAVTGIILGRNSFGGDIDIQVGAGVLGTSFCVALTLAYINIKRLQIEQHRAWMLRAWVWGASIITLRIFLITMSTILPMTGTYYSSQSCEKIDWLYKGNQTRTLLEYPECEAFFSGLNTDQFASVKGQFQAGTVVQKTAIMDMLFGTCLWLAWAIHILGLEIYLHLTPAEGNRLRKISYERQLAAGMKNPGRAGLTADRFGDAEEWTPGTVK